MEQKRFKKSHVFVFALTAAVAVGLWAGREYVSDLFAKSYSGEQSAKTKKKKKGVPVIVKPVRTATDQVRVESIGTARAKQFVTIYPETSGEIVDFLVAAGETVKKGQVILRLDSEKVELAEQLAETRLVEAQRLLERSKTLRSSRVNSTANVQDALTVYERAKLELATAREELRDRTIRAPFTGIVGISKVEVGDRVTPTMPIITIDNRETLLVEFDVAERYLSRLKKGHPVSAVTPTFPDRQIKGVIDKLDSRVDPLSRAIRVRAKFPNEDDSLRPGVSFFVRLELAGKEYPLVPQLALQWGDDRSYVWRVSGDKSERVFVRMVNRLTNTVLVEGDLKPGDLVVVEGVQRLRPGRRISYKKPEKAASKKPGP